ncbi:hypothetical protein N7519_000295 [Penicillium mononematosum]|uniref:uncharacterized protein n=1 Tax=Penicillium mononematosum TaxID=268346 RepID=UPI002549A068|nr:uncharacterized protein N7519_000295 [Penicillium mononematosum]KAJ6190274.1 hypothetical protein N7519_000295 [Penicillium mononematosum]
MAPIDPNHAAFGLDQPAFDDQAFLNGLANLDVDGPFNASNGFNYEENPDLMKSFDEYFASIPLDNLDMPGLDQPISATPANCSAQPVSNNIPAHAPHMQMTYDPSIGVAYTPEDTDADKIRKWENLIAQANLADAGVPPSAPEPIAGETVEQGTQVADSPNSLFDSPRSPSVEMIGTPSPTPPTPSPPQPPAATMATSNAAPNVTANTTHSVQLPRALTNQKGYVQHVSPFAPVATIAPPTSSTANSRELENARLRIQSLAKERSFYQRNLRKATAIDPKTGKTSLQKLQAENLSLRRTNANQARKLQDMNEEVNKEKSKFAALGAQYNEVAKRLHKAMVELRELKGQ